MDSVSAQIRFSYAMIIDLLLNLNLTHPISIIGTVIQWLRQWIYVYIYLHSTWRYQLPRWVYNRVVGIPTCPLGIICYTYYTLSVYTVIYLYYNLNRVRWILIADEFEVGQLGNRHNINSM